MNKLLPFLLLILALPLIQAGTNESPQVIVSESRLPAVPEEASLRTGASGGVSGGSLLQVGGIDRDGKPASQVLVLPLANDGSVPWKQIPLPDAPAWAAAAQNVDEVILAGGIVAGSPSTRVTAYRWDGTKVISRELPSLPSPLAGSGAAVLDGKLHVVGGIRSLVSREASREMLVLDLSSPQPKWEKRPPLPGSGKVLPMVTAQYDLLQVIGGRIPDGQGGFRASK